MVGYGTRHRWGATGAPRCAAGRGLPMRKSLPMTEPSPPSDSPDGATVSPIGEPRLPITDLSPPPDQAEALIEAGVAQIAATLHMKQTRRIMHALGLAATEAIVAEALQIEADGGLPVVSGKRRRTLGGVFFVIVRPHLSPEQQRKILPRFISRAPQAPATGAAQTTASAPPRASWATRAELIAGLHTGRGTLTSVKITLMGRPAEVSEQADFTLLNLTVTRAAFPTLPRGVPLPEPVPPTTYSVFIIVEGTQMLNAATKTIAVFATKTTTKLLQQANRPPKPPA